MIGCQIEKAVVTTKKAFEETKFWFHQNTWRQWFTKSLLKDLSYSPKQPICDKFIELHFLADIGKLVRTLRESGTDVEKLCEIEAFAKSYSKKFSELSPEKRVVKVAKSLKDNNIMAVAFDKGTGFCVMKKQ